MLPQRPTLRPEGDRRKVVSERSGYDQEVCNRFEAALHQTRQAMGVVISRAEDRFGGQ